MSAIEHSGTALMPSSAVPSSGGHGITGPAPADHGTRPAPAGNAAGPAPASNGAGSSPGGNASDPAPAGRGSGLATALRPLLIDVGVPLGSYYLLHNAFGVSLWLSLALSSIGPAVRAIVGLAARRELNLLAVLMLAVNLAGIAVSLLTGDPRAMIAKDSVVSSVIAFGILISAALRHPLMSAGLKPFITKGKTERMAAWDRLSTASARFRRLESLFSTIWGLALLAECVARLVGAYTLPVTTMVWLGTVFTLGAIGLAMVVGGAAAGPMEKMVDAEAAARADHGRPAVAGAGSIGQPSTRIRVTRERTRDARQGHQLRHRLLPGRQEQPRGLRCRHRPTRDARDRA